LSRGASKKALLIDLSSSPDEEDLIVDTSHDFEFTQTLYDELNRAILGSPDDSKIIIFSDSDEEEVREEKTTGTEDEAASAAVNPTSTASIDTDNAHVGPKMIIVMIRPTIRRLAVTTTAEVTLANLRLPRQEDTKADVL
jgi:hypothetical protein